MFNKIKTFILSGAVFISSFSAAQAVTLTPNTWTPLPGTTVAANPNLAGLVIKDDLVPFSFAANGGTISGHVQVRVVDAVDNTLDFYWRVFNDASSSGVIGDFRIGEFPTSTYNADYRIDGLGDVPPSEAKLFGSGYNGYVNFNFGDRLLPGLESNFFFLDTDATLFNKTGIYDLTNLGQSEISQLFNMYAPTTVPEPSTITLFGIGLAGIAFYNRKVRSKNND